MTIDSEEVEILRARRGLVVFRAQWTAMTSCSNPDHPLHGETASLLHRTVVRGFGGGEYAGQTRILIEFTGAGLSADLTGPARGPLACAAGECSLDLDVRANGGGIRLGGELDLIFDPQGISVPQEAQKLDFRVSPGGAP
jgi:hypothetical protein